MESSYNQMDCRGNAYATCRGQCVCELLGAMRMRTAGGDAYAICRGQRVCALQGAMRMRFVGGYANASCRGQCVCELPGAMRVRTAWGNAWDASWTRCNYVADYNALRWERRHAHENTERPGRWKPMMGARWKEVCAKWEWRLAVAAAYSKFESFGSWKVRKLKH